MEIQMKFRVFHRRVATHAGWVDGSQGIDLEFLLWTSLRPPQ